MQILPDCESKVMAKKMIKKIFCYCILKKIFAYYAHARIYVHICVQLAKYYIFAVLKLFLDVFTAFYHIR